MAVWFITGCSSGFGSAIARAALARGDNVIATARNASRLSALRDAGAHTISLDVTADDAAIAAAVDGAVAVYGRIDILVNNAAYGLFGGVEEASAAEVQAQFATNVFGVLAVTRAVLPHMRAARSGTVANIGSVAGWYGGEVGGIYCATKFALVGITESLAKEEAHLGIKAIIIEPGMFRTNFLSSSATVKTARVIDDLTPVLAPVKQMYDDYDNKQPGDVEKGAAIIVEVLTGTGRAAGKKLPLRLPLGSDAVKTVAGVLEKQTKELETWAPITRNTDHDN